MSNTKLIKTFNKIFYDNVINADKEIRDNLSDIIAFCKLVKASKEAKSLNQFLINSELNYLVETYEEKLKDGSIKIKSKLVRSGSFKNYLTFIYNIADNSEILTNDFMKSKNKVSTLSGLSSFINDIKNPKNKEAKNKSKKVSTSTSVEKEESELETNLNEIAKNLSIDDFKLIFNSYDIAFLNEIQNCLDNVKAFKLSEIKNPKKAVNG